MGGYDLPFIFLSAIFQFASHFENGWIPDSKPFPCVAGMQTFANIVDVIELVLIIIYFLDDFNLRNLPFFVSKMSQTSAAFKTCACVIYLKAAGPAWCVMLCCVSIIFNIVSVVSLHNGRKQQRGRTPLLR
ncbi:hypothetical protein ACOMHN_005622 [Nucella lapillus]